MTDLYDPTFRLSLVTGILGDALTDLKRRGIAYDERTVFLYTDIVVDKLKTAAAIDGLAAARGRGFASPND